MCNSNRRYKPVDTNDPIYLAGMGFLIAILALGVLVVIAAVIL